MKIFHCIVDKINLCIIRVILHQICILAQELQEKLNNVDVNDMDKVNLVILYSMNRLFRKYIDSSAQLELNIDSWKRTQLTKIFKQTGYDILNIEKVITLFENVAMDISLLMNDSNSRFRAETIVAALQSAGDVKL